MVTNNTKEEAEVIKFYSENYTAKAYRISFKKSNKKIIRDKPINKIKELLIEQARERKLHPIVKKRPESDRIRQLREELANISTVRKERVFDSEPTEEEKLIIQKRVMLQQLQFQEYEKKDFYRKLDKITGLYNFLNEEEVKAALEDCNNDEEQVILNLTQQDYLPKIRRIIALKYVRPEVETYMSTEQKEAYEKLATKRKNYVKKITSEDAKTRCYTYSRLRLDDALNQLKSDDPLKAFEGWSEARIKAYKMIDANPNTYYYRFNAPGEKQRNGAWTPEERKLFFKRLDEVGADGQWGIFSMTIPGRVGYQCSNFYRHLLKSKQIVDPNYIISNDGKMHYLFGKKDGQVGTIRRHNRHPHKHKMINLEEALNSSSSSTSRHNTRKRKNKYTYDDSDSDDYLYPKDNDNSGTYRSAGTTKRTRARYEKSGNVDENPLPGFTDPITLEEVVKPAISPYGHVMGYDSWVRCLNNPDCKNKCPITKKPLTKRELVILTFENIDQYRDKIIQ
ncbi:hypothetical protein BCR32DRAFT_267018 [Anaeromyces robustus]|uniref:Myb-like domain-containing protein n=1 Tax=Anaeromyces robustus TaxID=1754192 RepID=A0A1Y1XDA4_9FUNG|nr:hypothetical protein BCR32DRAFT_267018 [Anaeromyces robustus]|eukprot:ORX83354.1 hypothetical protein BCR32DRAFT_267018 [Anaeromyces robustus]